MDGIEKLLIDAYGETLGRMICGAYRTAEAAVAHHRARKEAEAQPPPKRRRKPSNVTPIQQQEAAPETA